jgi:predicted negative regulator of RcsB-dependent stress response
MARRDHGAAAEALEEIESASDRLSEWLQENLRVVIFAVAATLVIAGLGSWAVSSRDDAEEAASSALARTRDDYLSAMGAAPGVIDVPELANPEAAAQIRSEYEKRFGEVAAEHPGTVSGTIASLEHARLASEGGRDDEAIELLESALANAPSGEAIRGIVLQRIAQRLEEAERWDEAAARHEQAAALGDFPIRGWALVDAARCRAEAGDAAGALALYDRLERELPDMTLPETERARVFELRAALAADG